MNNTAKAAALLAVIIMTVSVASVASEGTEADPTGSWTDESNYDTSWYDASKDEFTLDSAAELAGIAKLVNDGTSSFSGKTITLTENGTYDLGAHNWVPIGKYTSGSSDNKPFYGSIEGNGATISNLYCVTSSSYSASFIENAGSAEISNLTISNATISGDGVSAALVARANSTTFTDCTVSGGTIESTGDYASGIAGLAYGCTFTGCTADGVTVSATGYAAPLIGLMSSSSTSEYCSSENCTVSGKTVSGLVANLYLDNTVSNSFVDSLEISGEPNAVGHVYGHILDGNLSASNLTYIGTVEWIGSFYDSDTMPALIEGTSDDGRIFYYGTLEAAKSAGITLSIIDGGVFGGDQTVTSNMTITLSGNATIPEGSTLTFEEGATIPSGKWVVNGIMVLQDQESLSSLTGATGSGNISINGKLYDPVTGELDSSAGDISWYDPNSTEAYEIGTAAQLIGFANLVNSGTDFSGKTVELTEDVDMEGYAFTPIGYMNDGSSYLRGTFDGNGNTVSNIDISSSGS